MRGINRLIPEAQRAASAFLDACKREGLNVLITDTLRSKSEQDALYAQGRTAPGNIVTSCRYPHSLHNWGTAWDFCRNERGREYDDTDGFFERVGAVAESLGLVWGGRFKTPDRPHIQLSVYAPDRTAAWLIRTYETPEIFIADKNKEGEKMDDNEFRETLERVLTSSLAREIVLAGILSLAGEPIDEPWQDEAIKWAAENGIFRGDGKGNLMPQKPVTRAELAQALKNLCESE